MSDEPRWRIIFVRCASPPESVPEVAIERQVSEPDLHEGVERVLQRRSTGVRPTARRRPDPLREIADLHGAGVRDADLADSRRARCLVETRARALRAGREGHGAVHEGPDMGLHRLDGPWTGTTSDLRHQPLVGHVDVAHLDLDGLVVEEVVELLFV